MIDIARRLAVAAQRDQRGELAAAHDRLRAGRLARPEAAIERQFFTIDHQQH